MSRRTSREMSEAELDKLLAQSQQPTVDVEVVEAHSDLLSEAEQQLRSQLEEAVEQAFWVAGRALQILRDQRLYRPTHRTFESYCQDQFGHSRQKAYFLIAAAEIYALLSTNGRQILPANERQIRPLNGLEPAQQLEAWSLAVAEAGGKAPSGRLVARMVESIRERNPEPNPYHVGDACQIVVRDEPELSGKHKCWALIRQVHPLHCTVACWDGEHEVKVSHLEPLNYSQTQCRQLARLEQRLREFQGDGVEVEAAAYSILANLGKLERPELTELEEKLLKTLEAEYLCN